MKKFNFPQKNLLKSLAAVLLLLAIVVTCMNISQPPLEFEETAVSNEAPPADIHKNFDILLRLYVDGTRSASVVQELQRQKTL